MEQSKKEFLLVLQGVKLSRTQSPTTVEDRKRMRFIPYALAIGSIKYAMLCTRSIVYPTLILAREYKSDLGVDHWTAVKIILSGIRICFLIMEVAKGSLSGVTSMQVLTLIQMTVSLNLDTY